MARQDAVEAWLAPTLTSIVLLAVVLVGSIVTVTVLSDRDAITLVGGIAVFAGSITLWLGATVTLGVRSVRRWRRSPDRPAGHDRAIQHAPRPTGR